MGARDARSFLTGLVGNYVAIRKARRLDFYESS